MTGGDVGLGWRGIFVQVSPRNDAAKLEYGGLRWEEEPMEMVSNQRRAIFAAFFS